MRSPPRHDSTSTSQTSSAFGELYARHAADVYRFALRMSGDRAEAEDITSEAFARALASPRPIRTATVRAYLFTIARNYYLQIQRSTRRHVPLGDTLEDARPGPSVRAEQAAELAALSVALQQLSEIDRMAVVMRALHQMSYEEIARSLGISVAAAKVKIHRARLTLAELR